MGPFCPRCRLLEPSGSRRLPQARLSGSIRFATQPICNFLEPELGITTGDQTLPGGRCRAEEHSVAVVKQLGGREHRWQITFLIMVNVCTCTVYQTLRESASDVKRTAQNVESPMRHATEAFTVI